MPPSSLLLSAAAALGLAVVVDVWGGRLALEAMAGGTVAVWAVWRIVEDWRRR